MMIRPLFFLKIRKLILFAVTSVFLTSCGSYQQVSYSYSDGIYSRGNDIIVKKRVQVKENDTYGDYFQKKANEYEDILENEIFN